MLCLSFLLVSYTVQGFLLVLFQIVLCLISCVTFQCSTIKEFDSKFTSKQFGYKDVDDYYSHATLHNKLHKICLPTLCLSAGDDPFQPFEGI